MVPYSIERKSCRTSLFYEFVTLLITLLVSQLLILKILCQLCLFLKVVKKTDLGILDLTPATPCHL